MVKESLILTKLELKKLEKRRRYHCCIQNSSTGQPCPGTRFDSSNIFKHLRRDLNFGPYYQLKSTAGNLPEGISLSLGDPCNLCQRLEELPPDQQVSESSSSPSGGKAPSKSVRIQPGGSKKALPNKDLVFKVGQL